MFDINLLSEPGIQLNKVMDSSISFIKTEPNKANKSNISSVSKNKKMVKRKSWVFPSISLYSLIFVAIVMVIFYPMDWTGT